MPEPFPRGNVPHNFRGLQLSLWAAHGTWWYEVLPAPRTAEERLRRPWRVVYRVENLNLGHPLTWPTVALRMGLLACDVAEGQSESLIQIR